MHLSSNLFLILICKQCFTELCSNIQKQKTNNEVIDILNLSIFHSEQVSMYPENMLIIHFKNSLSVYLRKVNTSVCILINQT